MDEILKRLMKSKRRRPRLAPEPSHCETALRPGASIRQPGRARRSSRSQRPSASYNETLDHLLSVLFTGAPPVARRRPGCNPKFLQPVILANSSANQVKYE